MPLLHAEACATSRRRENEHVLKPRELPELFEAGINVGACQGAEALHAEALAAEAPQDGAIDYGTAQLAASNVVALEIEALLSKVTYEASGEAIARAGRIEHKLQQIAGHHEIGVLAEQHSAVFAALNNERVRTHGQDFRGGLFEVGFAAEHTGLAVIDEQK